MHQSSKTTSYLEVTNSKIQDFFKFCSPYDRRIRIRTYNYGSASGRPKNVLLLQICIRNTGVHKNKPPFKIKVPYQKGPHNLKCFSWPSLWIRSICVIKLGTFRAAMVLTKNRKDLDAELGTGKGKSEWHRQSNNNTREQTPADYAPTATTNSDTQQSTVRNRKNTRQSVTNKYHPKHTPTIKTNSRQPSVNTTPGNRHPPTMNQPEPPTVTLNNHQ